MPLLSLHGREIGEMWRWDQIESVRLNTNEALMGLRSFRLHRKDGLTFSFDHHLEHVENQFGVRVQRELIRLLLPSLLHSVRTGEQVEFDSLSVSGGGLHRKGRFVSWQQVANITFERVQVTFVKWGGDGSASWSVPYSSLPNVAVFLALVHHLWHQSSHRGESALAVLVGNSLDPTTIQANSTNLQPLPHLGESYSGQFTE